MKYLTSHITINDILFKGIQSVNIAKSIHETVGTCKMIMPGSAILRAQDVATKVETAENIKRGDKVLIRLGYDGFNSVEFEGFVWKIKQGTPLMVECIDYVYQLRTKKIKKTYNNVKLLVVLQDIVGGTDIELDPETPDITIDELFLFSDENESVTCEQAIEKIKETLGLCAYFDGKVLYCGLHYAKTGNNIRYRLGWNCKDAGENLEYKQADESNLKIKAININDDNTRNVVEVGGGQNERTAFFYNIKSESELRELARNKLQQYAYDGYEGSFDAFMEPKSKPNDVAVIEDPLFPERNGRYFIDSTAVDFGQSGGTRTIEITQKI